MIGLAIVRGRNALRDQVSAWRTAGKRVALVPTMGSLHEGHLSLVRIARSNADVVVVSLFVNPTQFGPNEDFQSYPRDESRDSALLEQAGCDLLYAPEAAEVYPAGFSTSVSVSGISDAMEGSARPGHFTGVATVVTKLLIQVAPDVAVFGEKDYQQLQLIRRLAIDLDLPVEILAGPTVRDADGLALSSRNAYLTPEQRAVAPALHRALRKAAQAVASGGRADAAEAAAREDILKGGFSVVDYVEVRSADDLVRLGPGPVSGNARLLAVGRIGGVRLLDNLGV
jgi:pantoate--beta-alanine ligase